MKGKYDDIIDLPHHVSPVHKQMPLRDRAAQFAPFAALTGYDDAISETARRTESKPELSEDEQDRLNRQFLWLKDNADEKNNITITFFRHDEKKAGGKCIVISGTVREIDEYEGTVVMSDKRMIPISDIIKIDFAEKEKIRSDIGDFPDDSGI